MTDPARPKSAAQRRPKKQASGEMLTASGFIIDVLERHGVSTILLLGLAYVAHTELITPIAAAYKKTVEQVGANAEIIKEGLERESRLDDERVRQLTKAQDSLGAIMRDIERVADENRTLNRLILDGLAINRNIDRQCLSAIATVYERQLGRPFVVPESVESADTVLQKKSNADEQ